MAILTGLYVWNLTGFYNFSELWYGIRIMEFALGWIPIVLVMVETQ